MSETTSTVMHSAGNSDVVASHVVNDVIATTTTTQPKNAPVLQCEICNVTCNTQDVLEIHKLGEKHLKTLQKLAESSANAPKTPVPPPEALTMSPVDAVPSAITEPKMSPPKPVVAVASETLLGEVDNKNQELLESGDICNMMCSNQDEFMEHIAVPSAITEPKMSPPKPVVAVASETLVGELDDKNQELLESGDICNMMCSNQDEFMEHVASEKHSAKLADTNTNGLKNATSECGSNISSVTKPATFQCEVCKISCHSNEHLYRHFSGKKHQKKLKQSEEIPDPSLTPVVSLDQPESTEGKTVELHQGKPLSCDLCGIACNSYDMLKKHISGKKHQKNMEKSLQPIGPNPAPAMEPVATAPRMIGPFQDEGKMVEGEGSNSKAKRARRHEGKTVELHQGKTVELHQPESTEGKTVELHQGKPLSVTKPATFQCEVCKISCNSNKHLNRHFSGKKHLKKLKQSEEIPDPSLTPVSINEELDRLYAFSNMVDSHLNEAMDLQSTLLASIMSPTYIPPPLPSNNQPPSPPPSNNQPPPPPPNNEPTLPPPRHGCFMCERTAHLTQRTNILVHELQNEMRFILNHILERLNAFSNPPQ